MAGKRVAKKPQKNRDDFSRQQPAQISSPPESPEKIAYQRYYDVEAQEDTPPNSMEADYMGMPDEDNVKEEGTGRDRAAEIRAAIEAAITAQEAKRAFGGPTAEETLPDFDLFDAGESKDTGDTADEGPEILTEHFPRRSRPIELRPRPVPNESIKRSLPAVQTGKDLVEIKKAPDKPAKPPKGSKEKGKANKKSKKQAAKPSKKSRAKKIALYLLLGIIGLMGGVLFSIYRSAAGAYDPGELTPTDAGTLGKKARERAVQADPSMVRREGTYCFVVGATDNDGYRTDTMMLVFFEPAKQVLNILQIPRDLLIETGHDSNKANALYAYGKGALMKSALSSAFGIPIDNYVVINLTCFRTVVDKLGGVELNVPFDMDYEDPAQDLYIHLKAGLQTLDGKDAEGFVRFRYGYVDMDYGRMNAQKMFLAALAKTVTKPMNAIKVPGLIDTVFKNMKTDLTASEMLSYATKALKIPLENIRIFSMPSESWYYDGESGLTAYRTETMYIINNYFSPYDEMIENATLVEYGRKYETQFNLDGNTLVEIDENRPKFNLNPKWNWQEYLNKQQGGGTEQNEEEADTNIDTTPESDVGPVPGTEENDGN
ncbi:Transcriptional regulator LytR [bioreactor metagenome]|uniref:Transcriptional regulator LytR n=1 Tax=bioreactor metagenome TaxID=1076179 RepID=A0A645AQT4_9ZZZZ